MKAGAAPSCLPSIHEGWSVAPEVQGGQDHRERGQHHGGTSQGRREPDHDEREEDTGSLGTGRKKKRQKKKKINPPTMGKEKKKKKKIQLTKGIMRML